MMKGFKIDLKGRKQRMAYQEKQRLQVKALKDSGNYLKIPLTKGQLESFVKKLVK